MAQTTEEFKTSEVTLFHVRNAACVLLLFFGLLVAFFLLVDHQYSMNVTHRHQILRQGFNVHAGQLDDLLRRVTTWVEGIRIQAEFNLLESRQGGDPPASSAG
ncbi:MAG: hypothetical protein ACK5PS_01145 [Desulfopila sp.]